MITKRKEGIVMAFCPNCGSQLPEGADTCPNCGAPLAAPHPVYAYDPSDHTAEFDVQDIAANKLYAMASYLLGLVGVLFTFLVARESPYAMFHARQSIKISRCEVLLVICLIVPIIGWIAAPVGWIILLVIRVILFFQVCKGQAKDAPIIGSLGFLK